MGIFTEEKERRVRQLDFLIKPRSIYFAHPINVYNTPLESILIEKLILFFKQYHIENPNQKHHQMNYKIWKEFTGSGMKYYFDEVLPRMEAGVGMAFEDGKFGAGIYGELERLDELKKPIWEITHRGGISKIEDIKNIKEKALSIEETRERVYKNGR